MLSLALFLISNYVFNNVKNDIKLKDYQKAGERMNSLKFDIWTGAKTTSALSLATWETLRLREIDKIPFPPRDLSIDKRYFE